MLGAAAECGRKQEAARIRALLLAVPKSPPLLHPSHKQNPCPGRAFGQHRGVPLGARAFSPTMCRGDSDCWAASCLPTGTLGRAIRPLPSSAQPHDRWMNAVGICAHGQLPAQNQAAANSPARLPKLHLTQTPGKGAARAQLGHGAGQLTCTATFLPAQMSLLLPAEGAAEAGAAAAPTPSRHVGDAAASAVPRPCAVTAPADGFF